MYMYLPAICRMSNKTVHPVVLVQRGQFVQNVQNQSFKRAVLTTSNPLQAQDFVQTSNWNLFEDHRTHTRVKDLIHCAQEHASKCGTCTCMYIWHIRKWHACMYIRRRIGVPGGCRVREARVLAI